MNIGIPMSDSKTQYFINQTYVQYVQSCGFTPLLIAPGHGATEMLGMINGLLLPGGIDIDPIYYGEDNYSCIGSDPAKDEFERFLFHGARGLHLPIFGICRGFQLIAREFLLHNDAADKHCDFEQHISSHSQVEGQQLARGDCQHFVWFKSKGLYGADDAKKAIPVNSMHHQGLVVDKNKTAVLAALGMDVLAWTDRGIKAATNTAIKNVVAEAIEIVNWGAPIKAVQWHPEELKDERLLRNFFSNTGADKWEQKPK